VSLRGDLVYLDAVVRDPSGRVVARGSRRLRDQEETSSYPIALAAEDVGPAVPLRLELRLRSDRRDAIEVAATADGSPAVAVVRPADDGLRLVYADAGGTVYRRLNALPRFRWASAVEALDPFAGAVALQRGLPADAVVLAPPARPASGADADIEVRRDSADEIRLDVDADGAGYLVVADAIQTGWQAKLDGDVVPLRRADHAMVAVFVPEGVHTVQLAARPSGWRLGVLVSLAAVVVFVGLLVWALVRRRRRP
jgi:hypothetical protein